MLRLVPKAAAMLCLPLFGSLWASPAVGVEPSATCDYTIHYNAWITTFEPGQYKENQGVFGVKCLEACCQDPTCKGLAIESSFESQCYKYATAPLPQRLAEKAQPLSSFLLGDRVPEWSVFIKRIVPSSLAPVVGLPMPVLTQSLQSALASRPHHSAGMASEEFSLDARLRKMGGLQSIYDSKCGWTVFYNSWVPTFDAGEYSHDEFGGPNAHCLEKCCHDPSCVGLSLESTELYQCYKYSSAPAHLDSSKGVRLGDGHWLSAKRQSWSIFIKALEPNGSRSGQERRLVNHVTERTTETSDAISSFLSSTMNETSGGTMFSGLVPSDGWECLRWLMLFTVIAAFLTLLVTEVLTGLITTHSQAMLELKLHKLCTRKPEHAPLFGNHPGLRKASSDALASVA